MKMRSSNSPFFSRREPGALAPLLVPLAKMDSNPPGSEVKVSKDGINGYMEKPPSFATDPRVHYDQRANKWAFEDDDGTEMEWDPTRGAWVPVVSNSLSKGLSRRTLNNTRVVTDGRSPSG